MKPLCSRARSRASALACGASLLALGGCAALAPPAAAPPPPLQLLSSGSLDLPADCEPARGAVYRTHYVVEVDGRVTGATSDTGDGCVQQALRAWVTSFRYQAIGEAMPVVIDWLAVSASRGS
jgi:hypothetical protein